MTDGEQLIAQARAIHAKAMNCSDFADEGQWRAAEDVIDPPLHNYWRVTAIRAPHQKDVQPYPVTKALTQEPGVAGLLTFVSTALPQLCDLAEKNVRAAGADTADRPAEPLDELASALQSLQAEAAGLREALAEYQRLHKSVAADLLSAHQGRGNGTTQWMTEEDSDLRRDFRAAGDLARSALSAYEAGGGTSSAEADRLRDILRRLLALPLVENAARPLIGPWAEAAAACEAGTSRG